MTYYKYALRACYGPNIVPGTEIQNSYGPALMEF